MRRIGGLYEKVTSKEALLQGYLDAAKSKRGRRACLAFDRRLGTNINRLHESLTNQTYDIKPYYQFVVHEPKRRIIHAPAFRDTVVQHAIYSAVNPIFNAGFIDQSYACRKGMGTHKAADYCQQAIRLSKPESVLLQMDIRKFFYSIDRAILRKLVEKKIKDKRLVDLMVKYFETTDPIGIPIGNLLSQLYALIYLDPLDHFVKRELKCKLYCRYVDDFILFNLSPDEAVTAQKRIEDFLLAELNLKLSKWQIRRTNSGANFVGYRTWRSKRFIRKYCMYKFRRAAKKGNLDAVVSTLGHARQTSSVKHLVTYLKEHHNELHNQLPKIYRPNNNQNTHYPRGRHRALHNERHHLRVNADRLCAASGSARADFRKH